VKHTTIGKHARHVAALVKNRKAMNLFHREMHGDQMISQKQKSPIGISCLLLFIFVFGVSIDGTIGSDGDAWYEAQAGFTWRF
jgi:hypothetical protein